MAFSLFIKKFYAIFKFGKTFAYNFGDESINQIVIPRKATNFNWTLGVSESEA